MLAAFGFLRFSCSLFTHCFAKTKKRRQRGSNRRHSSDSDDEDTVYLPSRAVSAAKTAIAKVAVRVRPPCHFARPRLSSLWSCFVKKKRSGDSEAVAYLDAQTQQGEESEICVRDLDVRNRRSGNKVNYLPDVLDTIPWPQLDTDRQCSESLSSEQCSYYPSERPSDNDDVDVESSDFGMGSDFTPRTSVESFTDKDGLNPMFYHGSHSSDEDEADLLHRQPEMRRISSLVDCNLQLREMVRDGGNHRQLLVNPAYRKGSVESQEDSETGDTDFEPETKMKSLKSLVKTGCRVLPISTALVGSQYIGNTSLNPTYGDHMSQSDGSDNEDVASTYAETPFTLPPSPFNAADFMKNEASGSSSARDQSLNLTWNWTPRSLPMLSFCELGSSGKQSENMGTLTWRNVIFSPAEGSENEDHAATEANRTVADLQIRWKETLRADSMELDALSDRESSISDRSAISDPSTRLDHVGFGPPSLEREAVSNKLPPQRKVKGITKKLVTPIRSVSHEAFEEIDFKGHPVSESRRTRMTGRISQGAKLTKSGTATTSSSSNNKSQSFLATGLKHTRCALRLLSLLVNRVEVFAAADKKK